MEILIITGSPRRGANTETMAAAFAEGAREVGNTVTTIKLSETKVAPCLACEYCFAHEGVCVQDDGMSDILAAMDQADMVVFASPIYYFGISAQLSAAIDRLYARAKTGYHPTKCALLLNAASEGVFTSAVAQYQDMAAYLKWKDMGVITASGMSGRDSMAHASECKLARVFGRSLT